MGGPCVRQDGPRALGCVGSAVRALGLSVGPALEEAWSREADLTDLTPQPARLSSNSFSKLAAPPSCWLWVPPQSLLLSRETCLYWGLAPKPLLKIPDLASNISTPSRTTLWLSVCMFKGIVRKASHGHVYVSCGEVAGCVCVCFLFPVL